MSISGIVLAGGKGLRLGRDKVSETVGNRSLLEQAVLALSFLEGEVIIVTAADQSLHQSIDYPKLTVVADSHPGWGPLGGIYAGLTVSKSFYNLVVACDMPFLNQALLLYMIQVAPGFDLAIPRVGNLVEPLHAVYSKDCLPPIASLLQQGNLSILDLFDSIRVRYVEAEEIDRFDPEHLSFFNINTEADLARARGLALKEMSHDKC